MKKPALKQGPELSLSVQYAMPDSALPRWRIRRWVQAALNSVANLTAVNRASFTLRLVDEDEGRDLNKQFRNRDYATNVLTFEYGVQPDASLMADIVLCLPVLHKEAQAQHKSVHAHAAHLTIHGVLHALGYDHQNEPEAQEMEAIEAQILTRLGFTDPYRVLPESH
ncbi:MAG: rRNA maturation RNase YbeY [Pusillimonas sp.]|nr:rRNA maturation RNase YbeY [Pusillimonas sp.]